MKSVLYVSVAVESQDSGNALADIPNILIPARRHNRAAGLTGVLGFQDGHYIQLLQGPEQAVETVLNRIRKDRRHREMHLLVEAEGDAVYFEGFSLKLSSPNSDNRPLSEFMQRHQDSIESRVDSPMVLKVLSDFGYVRSESSSGQAGVGESVDLQLKLERWPDFDVIKPLPRTLDACAALIKGWTSCELLVQTVFDGDQAEAQRLFADLSNHGGLCERSVSASSSNTNSALTQERQRRGMFYNKMKTYLKSQFSGLLR